MSKSPKISVVITVYNGESYLKTTILSVLNQDFKDIEILMIDDGSKDNSVEVIKDLMVKDNRIILNRNDKNRGMLYTKIKGILLAKGKYILLLDEDDIYCQRDAFSTLYKESEKNNLDILNFNIRSSTPIIETVFYNKSKKSSPIIFQPELSQIMFKRSPNGTIISNGGMLTNLFIKRNILVKVIKEIDEKYLNEKMNYHDDFMIYFLLTRNAYNFQKIDRLFYIILKGWNTTNEKVKFRIQEKMRNAKYMRCNSHLNFIEFTLNKTKDNFFDKKYAFYFLSKWFLDYWCRNFSQTFDKAINISRQFLRSKYIKDFDKKKIKLFLKEINYSQTNN